MEIFIKTDGEKYFLIKLLPVVSFQAIINSNVRTFYLVYLLLHNLQWFYL